MILILGFFIASFMSLVFCVKEVKPIKEIDMMRMRLSSLIRLFLLIFSVGVTLDLNTTDAEARAGRGRSSGRPSSFGSRQAPPSQQYGAPNQFGSPATNPAMNNNRGGFLRSMAGGVAGGFLGSMLFSSMGRAAGGGMGGGTGGGIGLFEIILFAGMAYFAFRWWKSRQQPAPAFTGMNPLYHSSDLGGDRMESINGGSFRALAPVGIDREAASDLFFKVQGAWTKRDLSSVRNICHQEIRDVFDRDLAELVQNRQINRLENISIRRVDVTNSWEEGGDEFSTVRFTANLLDYTVHESTGQVLEGSDTTPIKFEEDWTFTRPVQSATWQLLRIEQV
jgi:hypothetical protein